MTENSTTEQTSVPAATPEAVSRTVEDGPEPINRNQFVDYALLLKPRVMSLVLFTGFAGMILAPGDIDILTATIAVISIAVGAGASGAINMWYDRDIDSVMERTMNRPLPAGRLKPPSALWLGIVLSLFSVSVMAVYVNPVSAALLAVTIAFYVFIYTIWLKRRTPQNIVIGGASGALPPMIGWAAVTNDISIGSLVLFAIIFMWTPPHFWALSLYRSGDYEKAGVPMMPVVSGVEETKRQILIYTLLLVPLTVVPAFIGMISVVGGVIIGALGLWFIRHAFLVKKSDGAEEPRAMFRYSIAYLFFVFLILLADSAILSAIS